MSQESNVILCGSKLMNQVSVQSLEDLESVVRGLRIVVLGDVMLDHFVWGQVRRISPEAPVPVVEVQRETFMLGGAGNACANIAALGAHCVLVSVVGNDDRAQKIRSLLKEMGINADGLVTSAIHETTVKTRIIAASQHVVRVDYETAIALPPGLEEQLIRAATEYIHHSDVLIFSDYAKGVLGPTIVRRLIQYALSHRLIVVTDSKAKDYSQYRETTTLTPNVMEASRVSGIDIVDDASLFESARRLIGMTSCEALLITRGAQGLSLFLPNGDVTHYPADAREVYDVTGAGDTVVAILALARAAGIDWNRCAWLANKAAGIVVEKPGTALLGWHELRDRIGQAEI